jgi:eukaryotic-like serine/threonine-protein kinase
MTLTPQTRLGPYEIQSAIGAGGMGEVYKARDTRLERSVAIKVLPPDVSANPDRRARFEREAKTIAGLSHPHICTLFDVGESNGATYLVMEHLVGETLAQRLEKGPLPPEQALTVATDVAEALAAAHRQGIIHRDLKPGNVMLTKSGAKLLDFGLARLSAHGERPAAASLASAPTRTTPLTTEGAIVGTLQYMAPEQVEGKPADARTDLWALGAVLYETLTGRRAFEADSAASLIGAILEREPPPLATLQPLTPPGVNRLVRRCLAKDADARWQSAADVADELRWLQGESGAVAGPQPRRRRRMSGALAVVAGLAIVAAASALLTWYVVRRGTAPTGGTLHLAVTSEPAEGIRDARNYSIDNRPIKTSLALTGDGRRLIFVGLYETVSPTDPKAKVKATQLYVRDLTKAEPAKPIPGTVGAYEVFLSPDERWIGFSVILGNPGGRPGSEIRKVPIEGGSPQLVATAKFGMGASWGDDGRVVFAENNDSGLSVVPNDGGTPAALTTLPAGEYSHRLPHVLPGSRAVLFTVLDQTYNWDTARVVVHRFGTTGYEVVAREAADARYVATGHLVYVRKGQLVAAPFDLESLKVTGSEKVVLPSVMQAANYTAYFLDSGAGQIAISAAGTLAYVAGGCTLDQQRNVVWIDRSGRQVGVLAIPPKAYGFVRLSPDETRVAMATSQSDRRIWVHDLRQPGSPWPITNASLSATSPLWTPDGERVVFTGNANGRYALYMARADGAEVDKPEPMGPSSSLAVFPASWAANGELLYIRYQPAANLDIWAAVKDGGTWRDREVVGGSTVEMHAQMSPDKKWLAYSSGEIGNRLIRIRRWPTGEFATVPTQDLVESPVWSRTSPLELFYLRGRSQDQDLVAHSVGPDGRPAQAGRSLFRVSPLRLVMALPVPGFDVAKDGRFLFPQRPDEPPRPLTRDIQIVVNWFEELKAKVPVK